MHRSGKLFEDWWVQLSLRAKGAGTETLVVTGSEQKRIEADMLLENEH